MSALFGFICGHLECARMKDASRATYGVYTESVGYVDKFCSVWSFQCETLRLLYAFAFYLNQRYVGIASWDIRILVAIAPNLNLCRLHVAPFNSTGPYSTDEHGDLSFLFRFHISSRSLHVLWSHILLFVSLYLHWDSWFIINRKMCTSFHVSIVRVHLWAFGMRKDERRQ